ncbi:PREDICTED: LOW QUALITY PROTEIN: cytochrome P450 6a22-like [Rhagoletis zephyria]|uniref:LOW QUALITY PROTEIN: cytochrome P450 6a22-like n=1 Tax=Rhagoletis zephyria TaxID=28612 RepID=UPI0008114AFA|nr:PREDICTED: LOW QUALITY PROTEIN: cytochrome P450 6a22-like [Rhagoletis zephyria]
MLLFFILLTAIVSLLVTYLQYKYQYWARKGVPQTNLNFLENICLMRTTHNLDFYREVYRHFRGKSKFGGTYIFAKPILVLLDLDLIKQVLIKDFNTFPDRFEYIPDNNIINGNLFKVNAERWRPLRTKITPTFTSAKMKFMFPTLVTVAKQLDVAFGKHLENTPDGTLNIYEMMTRFTVDVIGQVGFGVVCNSLEDPNTEFLRVGHINFFQNHKSIRLRILMTTYPVLFKLLHFLNIRRVPDEVEKFMLRLVRDTARIREEQKIQRNDFMNLMIEMKNTKDENGKPMLTYEEMAAQVFIFFAGGYETSSSNLTYALYELAKNQHVQDKLRAEINSVLAKHNGELTYEAMDQMTYLYQVMSETLRKYTVLAVLPRISIEEYTIPGTNIKLEKGTHIAVPINAIHHDPEIYESPHEFRPERFAPEELQKRHPQAFLGFGDGPRNCIGLRFARMQVRVGLITLLKSYRFTFSEKTPPRIDIMKKGLVLVPDNIVWLKATKL